MAKRNRYPGHIYVEEISLAAILAAQWLAGAVTEMDLKGCTTHICLCQAEIRLFTLAFKPKGDVTKSLKHWYDRSSLSMPCNHEHYYYPQTKIGAR